MNNTLYAAYLGMRARQRALDITANNIANASTTGFRGDRLQYQSVESSLLAASKGQSATPATGLAAADGALGTTGATAGATTGAAESDLASTVPAKNSFRTTLAVATASATDFTPGAINQTGRSLDVALAGDGFLTVQTARGERYTRNGSLSLDSSGQLITGAGDLVVGSAGPITVPPGEISIGEDGTLSVNGRSIDRLKVVRFGDPRSALLKEGGSLFAATGTQTSVEAVDTRVMQGSLESSNVNTVTEMVAMLQQQREFDSLQRSVTLTINDLGRKVASQIGSI
jgi:flagellar basal-body rod protein FlgF